MNSKFIYPFAFTALLLSTGCMKHSDSVSNPAPMTVAQRSIDAKILENLIVINQNEIAAAEEVEKKSSNTTVKNYAGLMINVHGKNLQETETLAHRLGITPEHGSVAMALQTHGKQELISLKSLKNSAFDKRYIAMMIKGQGQALKLLDQKLLPQAYNPRLKQHLEATRVHIEAYLQQAKAIQHKL